MATVSEAIDEMVDFVDNTGTSQTDQAERRRRHLQNLKRGVRDIRYYRDWDFIRSYSSVAVAAAAGFGYLPTDFLAIGKYGGVYDLGNNGCALDWVPESIILELRVRAVDPGQLAIYSIFGLQVPTPPGTGAPQRMIQIPPNTSAVSLGVAYNTKAPTLDETVTNNAKLVLAVPEEYHDTVLLPHIKAMARESLGDARWQNAVAEYERGLKSMLRTCRRSQGTIGRLPSFFG